MCMVTQKKDTEFKCNECTLFTNAQCRSYKDTSESTTIKGTNIDTADLDLPESPDFNNTCVPVKPGFFKIVSTKQKGDAKYDMIDTFYEGKRELMVVANFMAEGALRKVYRYFPKYYVQVDNDWMSMVSRVRTVAGNEKKFSFETMVIIEKSGKSFKLFLDPKKDPGLKRMNFNLIYNTN